jgi:hypothetical protein
MHRTRGELPLALAVDRGSQYENEDVRDYLDRRQVVLLPRLPRTPQHNAWSERGIRELKAAAPARPSDAARRAGGAA